MPRKPRANLVRLRVRHTDVIDGEAFGEAGPLLCIPLSAANWQIAIAASDADAIRAALDRAFPAAVEASANG